MTGRPSTLAPLLDWRAASHWSHRARPCRWCARPTHLRDTRRRPAHKVCTEQAIARQNAEAADAYQNGTLA